MKHNRKRRRRPMQSLPDGREPRRPVFAGERMRCLICEAEAQSHPGMETDWRALEVDGRLFYFCRAEFPPNGASADDFAIAYQRALLFCIQAAQKLPETELLAELRRPVDWGAERIEIEIENW